MAGQQQVCKFFRQGNCKFGTRCHFLHPPNLAPEPQRNSQPGNRNSNNNGGSNRFGALSGFGGGRPLQGNNSNRSHNDNSNAFSHRVQDNRNPRNNSNSNSRNATATNKYGISAQMIEDDLTMERPEWILSCYGPSKDAPVQLFGGEPMETSPEELRYQTYLAAAQNVPPEECAARENALYQAAQNQIMQVLNDISGALEYIELGSKQHPNRIDSVNAVRVPRGAYFAKSNFRSRNPRGQQNQTLATNAPAPTFFQSAQLPQQPSSFGNSSAFGASLRPSQSFGQQASDQDAQMDTPSNPTPTFGTATTNSVIQPSFSTTGFGAPQSTHAFGINNHSQPPQISGSSVAGPSLAFGTAQPSNSFGQPSPFGQVNNHITNSTNTGFGNSIPAQALPASFQQTQPVGFQQTQPVPVPVPAPSQPPPTAPTVSESRSHTEMRDMSGRLTSWNGHSVKYEGNSAYYLAHDGKSWERIWIPEPNGSQVTLQKAFNALADLPPADEYPVDVKSTYEKVLESGVFLDMIPELPPRPEWTSYHV